MGAKVRSEVEVDKIRVLVRVSSDAEMDKIEAVGGGGGGERKAIQLRTLGRES